MWGSLRLAPIIHKPMNWLVPFTTYLRFFSSNSGTKYSNGKFLHLCNTEHNYTKPQLGKVTQKFAVATRFGMGLTNH